MNLRRSMTSLALAVTLPFWYGVPQAHAQDFFVDGSLPFLIRRPAIELVLSQDLSKSRNTGPYRTNTNDSKRSALELTMNTSGFVYHPALLTFSFGVAPSFVTSSNQLSDQDELTQESNFLGYEVDTTWLSKKPYTLTLSAAKVRGETTNSFAIPTRTETRSRKAALTLKNALLPTRIEAGSSDSLVDGYYLQELGRNYWSLRSNHTGSTSQTDFLLTESNQVREIGNQERRVDYRHGMVTNRYQLTTRGRIVSNLLFRESDDGSRPRRTTSARSAMSFDHRLNLQSIWQIGFARQNDEMGSALSESLQASITHHLYENLTTSVSMGTENYNSDRGDTGRDSKGFNIAYLRQIPLGRMRLTFGKNRLVTDDQRPGDQVQIIEEAYVFDGISTSLLLDNANVDPASVVVSSDDGLTIYEPGIDYRLEPAGAGLIVLRNPLAGIGDGQTVLISYVYQRDPPSERQSDGDSVGAEFRFGRLSLSYSRRHQEQTLLFGNAPDQLPFNEYSSYSAAYSHGFSNTTVRLTRQRTHISNYEMLSIVETMSFTPSPRMQIGISGQLNELDLKDAGIKRSSARLGLSLGLATRGSARLRVSAFLHREEGEATDQTGWGINSEYNWRYGAWLPRIRLVYADLVDDFSANEINSKSIYFDVRRSFR